MTDHDHTIEDLLRRSYADHEHLAAPGRELDVMARAQAGTSTVRRLRQRRPRRFAASLLGVAAACALLLVVVGAVVMGGMNRGGVPAARPEPRDVAGLTQQVRHAVEQSGTMTVTDTVRANGSEVRETRRLDLRDPSTPRLDLRRDGERGPWAVRVGNEWWRRHSVDQWFRRWDPAGSDPVWLTLVDLPVVPEGAWLVGQGQIDGVPADHVVVLPGVDSAPTPAPAQDDEPWAGRAHLDLWITRDSGRIVRATVVTRAVRTELHVAYGEDMTITPPRPEEVDSSPAS